jgi:sulfate adenylyltransferase large subunit
MSAANFQTAYEPIAAAGLLSSSATPLRFTTAGSVDDGKSTLIGRLLYDSKAVYEDQLASVKKSRINRSTGPIDFSLLTDGLRAEREQGITIDVAYRYFSTPRRKFIIADTPGHEQYTRNMATGASTADAAIVLVDATKGLLPQSRRHAYIASLLGIRHVVAAVNKMDLVDYSADVFQRVEEEFQELASKLGLIDVYAIPISALHGDNVVRSSPRTPWFNGAPLLQYLEELPGHDGAGATRPVRFPIQLVIRPDARFRGFAGQLEAGTLRPGDDVVALPAGIRTRVKSIVTYDGELDEARAGDAITVTLHDEVDLSRGDVLVGVERGPSVGHAFDAKLVWMHADSLDQQKLYLLKHTTRTVRARVQVLRHRVDVNTLAEHSAGTLNMNDIALVKMHTTLPLMFDAYSQVAAMGSFILIDPITNATVAAGMIAGSVDGAAEPALVSSRKPVTAGERQDRFGHSAAAIWLQAGVDIAEQIERELFDRGCNVLVIPTAGLNDVDIKAVARVLHSAGAISIFAVDGESRASEEVREVFGDTRFLRIASGAEDEISAQVLKGISEWQLKPAVVRGRNE